MAFKPGIHPWSRVGGNPEHRDFDPDNDTHQGVDIHPLATISAFCSVDAGMRVPTRVGAHTVLMQHVHVGHDAWIGDRCELAPGTVIGGHVKIGHRVRIGVNACVRPGVTVGEGARIGCGAVVIRNVPPGEIWVGNPARCIRNRDDVATDGQTVHDLTAP